MTTTESRQRQGAETGTTIRSVSFVVFVLRFAEPGGVTVPGTGDVQAELDTGPGGRVRLPGTSLAGALRELVARARGDEQAAEWFGPLLEEGAAAKASRVWVLGGHRTDDEAGAVIRSTRIDRHRGAADVNTLRAEEVLPPGAEFEVFLRWNDAAPEELEDLAGLIAGWRPLIGRGTSRGRGRCEVTETRHGTLRFDDPGHLLTWLTFNGPGLAREVARQRVTADASGPDPDLLFRVPVRITGPWRIGTGEAPPKDSQKPIPLRRLGGVPVVPGSSAKGLLRSRAEYILRSVGVTPAPCGRTPGEKPCGGCWTCGVFGYGGGKNEEQGSVGTRAAVRVADAVVSGAVPASRTHVAIDRFTGGARDQALFTMAVLEDGTFPLAVEWMPGAPEDRDGLGREVRAVLRLVLEDLDDGIIGMGGGTARGYGSVMVDFAAAAGLPSLDEARRELARMAEGGTSVG